MPWALQRLQLSLKTTVQYSTVFLPLVSLFKLKNLYQKNCLYFCSIAHNS
jgi:hypothetical protein